MSVSVRSLWVVFEPTALSVPPLAWTPLTLGCNSSLSGTQDFGDDWCGYADLAALLVAYNWFDQGGWWSDYNEPIEDYEGRIDIGAPYWNVAVPMAPDWWHCTMEYGLPFNGGSTAMVFDSADASFGAAGNRQLYIYALTGNVPTGGGGYNTIPDIPGGGPDRVTCVSRIFIDGAVSSFPYGSQCYVTPVECWFVSTGAFGEAYAYIGRNKPYPLTGDPGSAHLYLALWSYNTTGPNQVVVDCGDASDIINDAIGYEFSLMLRVVPATSSAYDKIEAVLSVYPLPGATGTFAGTWVARAQNLMAQDARVHAVYVHNNGGTASDRVRTGTYSYEVWTGTKIWLGSSQPAVTSTTDSVPTPDDNTVVTGATKYTDAFNPRPPRGANTSSPVVPLPSPWARFNDSGKILLLAKDGVGHAQVQIDVDGSNVPRGAYLAVPQVVTDLDYKLTITNAPAANTNSGDGMYMEESATGKWVWFGIHNNGTNRRMSVRKGTGAGAGTEVFRGSTNISGTSGYVQMERASGQWYFYHDIGGSGFVTDYNAAIGTFFTTGPDRVGFGAMAASGAGNTETFTVDSLA